MSDILISIHGRHVAKILDGSKTFELRRRFHTKHEYTNTRLWIYETSPKCAVVATACIDRVAVCNPEYIWKKLGKDVGVTHEEFAAYFGDRESAYAIKLAQVEKLTTPITLAEMRAAGIQPPQSYRTVPAEIAAQWEAKR